MAGSTVLTYVCADQWECRLRGVIEGRSRPVRRRMTGITGRGKCRLYVAWIVGAVEILLMTANARLNSA